MTGLSVALSSSAYTREPAQLKISHSPATQMVSIRAENEPTCLYEFARSDDLRLWVHYTYRDGTDGRLDIETSGGSAASGFFRAWCHRPLVAGEEIDYLETNLAFAPHLWTANDVPSGLFVYEGREVALLANERWLAQGGSFDPLVISTMVDKMDRGWAYYNLVTGHPPAPWKTWNGLPVVAALPHQFGGLTCGYGCGYIGSTGVELMGFYENDYPLCAAHPNAFNHYIFYEMGRNHFVFGDKHSLFTTGYAVFMRYMVMDHLGLDDPDAPTREWIRSIEDTYSEDPSADWHAAFDPARPIPDDAPVHYAALMLALIDDHGEEFLMRFYREIDSCPSFPLTMTNAAGSQALSWVVAASVAARQNLVPLFVNRWKFPIPSTIQSALGGQPFDGSRSAGEIVMDVHPGFEHQTVDNPSFESELSNWNVGGWKIHPNVAVAVSGVRHTGNSALRIHADTGDPNVIWCTQSVDLEPRSRYRFTAWARTEGILFEENPEFGVSVGAVGLGYSIPTLVGSSDWTKLQMEFSTGDESSVDLILHFGTWGSAVSGTVWFDDAELRSLEPFSLPFGP